MTKPMTRDAYELVHDGTLALSVVEDAGIRIDVEALDKSICDVKDRIDSIMDRLNQTAEMKLWKRRYGSRFRINGRGQLASILSDLGLVGPDVKSVDADTLEDIDNQFVKDYLALQKLLKLKNTYLMGIRREVCDGFLRPSFNLNLAATFRSSCTNPNFQNIPIRDKEIGKMVRGCFIPRDGHVLVEVDFSALEFRVAACFWRDDAMVAYASDSSLDIHRDMAGECYLLDDVPKTVRFFAKNQFVFPQLYGSYYVNCARNLWNVIESAGLETVDGVSLYDHLYQKGIRKLGACDSRVNPLPNTFENHIREVEANFHNRFPQWSDRKEKWWNRYEKNGWFPLMTGFRCSGVYSRNNLYNTPIQGPAFHLLLWSLIQMVRWQIRSKMKSRIIGQIHDSIVADVHKSELDDWIAKAKQVMTKDVRNHWDWIITPLEVEVEVAETNWFEKKEIKT